MNQLISYAIIGVVSNVSGYLIYLLLTFFLVGPKMAMTAVYLTGAIVGFLEIGDGHSLIMAESCQQ